MTTTRPPLHLCIATGQNLANLIPALQCDAREVWILQTATMRASNAAGHLADALKQRSIKVERIDFDDADVTTLNAQAEMIAERLDGQSVVINLSGGTKLMTLALVRTLAAQLDTAPPDQRPHLVYTDTAHSRLDWLSPGAVSEPMRDVLRLDDILFAQGYRRVDGSGGHAAAEAQQLAHERRPLTTFLGKNVQELDRDLGALNRIAHKAFKQAEPGKYVLSDPIQQLRRPPQQGGVLSMALAMARDAGLVAWEGGAQVVFISADAARYLCGGWTEEFVAAKLRGMRLTDHARGLEILHVISGTKNELDAVAVHGNRLLLVECKAAQANDAEVMDWIYKTSQLTRAVGGSHAQALLVSARPLSEAQRHRAQDYGIDVLAGGELATLPEYLRKWRGDV